MSIDDGWSKFGSERSLAYATGGDIRLIVKAIDRRDVEIERLRKLVLTLGNCPECGTLWDYAKDRCSDDCGAHAGDGHQCGARRRVAGAKSSEGEGKTG